MNFSWTHRSMRMLSRVTLVLLQLLLLGCVGPSATHEPRSDENIQEGFNAVKADIYRIYNRALRENPKLEGHLVLRIIIAAEGRVAASRIEKSSLTDNRLANAVNEFVQGMNFGPAERSITILYPIHFLSVASDSAPVE